MKELQINSQLFKSYNRYEFVLGLTKDLKYRQSLLDATQITKIEDWEPYELKIKD